MKYSLIGIFGALALWSLAAILLIPDKTEGDKTPLVWTTDPNPQRGPQVDLFNEKNPDCLLAVDPGGADVMKVVVQSSAGMGPDLIDHVFELTIQTYIDAGILWDITDQAKEMGFGPDTLSETTREFVMVRDPETLEFRQYAYPCNIYHQFVLYNKNVFDKYGIPYPPEDMTWDEYIALAKRATIYEKEGDKIPAIFGGADIKPDLLIWQRGGAFLNKDGTRCLLDQPEAIAGMKFYHDLLFKYEVEPTPTQRAGVTTQGGWGSFGYINWFGEGRLATLHGARWMLIQFRRFIMEQRRGREIWLAEHPGDTNNAPEVLRMGAILVPRFPDCPRRTIFSARCTGINKESPHRDKALKFLQFLAGPEYSRTINEGADSKPGNEKYATMELMRHPDWPEEEEINLMSIKSVPYGRTWRRSMFVNHATVMRMFDKAKDQLIANPDYTEEDIARAMKSAADEINAEIRKNINRNPKLRQAYEKLIAQGAAPIAEEQKR